MKKRVLVFYPHNFYEMSAGTHKRIFTLLGYFKERKLPVDLITLSGYTNRWGKKDIERKDLCETINVCEWKPTFFEKRRQAQSHKKGALPDLTTGNLKTEFRRLITENQYGYIIITYVYWASLLDVPTGDSVNIYNFQDFLTLSSFLFRDEQEFRYGKMFEDEVRAINKFKFALCISEEEALTFTPFCPNTLFINSPISLEPKFNRPSSKEFDLLFVGSDNPFNVKGIKWFFDEVYPLISRKVKIGIVGRISTIVEKHDDITIIPFIDNLDDVYTRSKILICPLWGGTGLKVKVVEALSYGIPVITTSWGLTGILQKRDNGCIMANKKDEFARAITELLSDGEKYKKLKQQAETFFMEHFSNEAVFKNNDKVFLSE